MKKLILLLSALVLALGVCQGSWAETECDSFLDYGKAVASLESLTAKDASDQDVVESRLLMRSKKPMEGLDGFGPLAVVKGPGNRYTLQFASVSQAVAAMEILKTDENVKYVQQDGLVSLDDVTDGESYDTLEMAKAAAKSASPYMSWGAKTVGADEFAASIKSSGSVTVAVVDTGVASHPFLNSRVKAGGADFTDPDRKDGRHDINSHGTHVAGTVVDLTQGLTVYILPVRVLGDDGRGSKSAVTNGILYAVEAGAKVINMSLGGLEHTPYIDDAQKDAVDYAYSKGVTVVVAAGNKSMDASFVTPASFRNCITVSALDPNIEVAFYSNYGDPIDVAAPGTDIVSCSINGGFVNKSGTSMASPHVAAIAAMVKLKYPGYSPSRIDGFIKDNCLDIGDTGWDPLYGYGMPCFITKDTRVDKDYSYRVVNGEASITGYTGTDTEITLPKTLGGFDVTAVDAGAFSENASITGVTIPGNILQIGEMAFNGCASLKRATLEKGLLKVGMSAFENCQNLSDVTLPEGLRDIDGYAFNCCRALENIELPQSLVSLGPYSFAYSGIKELNIPGSVETIASYVVIQCENLTSLIINEGTTCIDSQIVSSCTNLKRIELPKTVTTLKDFAFAFSCIESISMPGVVNMGGGVFLGCSAIREATFTEGLKSIPTDTFVNCPALEKVYVPRSVESVHDESISDCPKLTMYVYRGSEAEKYAKDLKIPCEYLGYQYAIEKLSALNDRVYSEVSQRLLIDGLVSYEPYEAGLSYYDIVWESSGPAVAEILPFNGNYGYIILVAGEGTATITGTTVDGSDLKVSFDVVSAKTVAQEVRINKTMAALNTGETLQLTATVLPKNADQAILWTSSDPNVATVTGDGLVTAVGTGSCTVTAQAADYYDIDAECAVTVASELPQDDDFIYAGDPGSTVITGYKGSALQIEIPAYIDGHRIYGIASGAFKNSGVTSVKIPEGIEFIDREAFMGATKLEKVSLPDSLARLAPDAFKGCKKLPKVKSIKLKIAQADGLFSICPVFTPADTASAWSVSSSDKNIVAVYDDLLKVLTDGYAKITVKAGGKTTVVGFKDGAPYAAAKLSIKGKAKRQLKVDKTLSLSYKVQPATAQVLLTWSSDNNDVATVNGQGIVTGVAPGKAVITIQTDIGLSDKVTVIVK